MKKKIFVFLCAVIFALSFSVKSFAKETMDLNQITFMSQAVEAGEMGDYEAAYNYYGHAFWEGNMDAKTEMNRLLESGSFKEYYNFKYDKMCPIAKDEVKTNHIRLSDGSIIEDGGKIKFEDLKNANIVFNDEEMTDTDDYYIVFITSDEKYVIENDPYFDFGVNMAIEKGHEYNLSKEDELFRENDDYNYLTICYLEKENYEKGDLFKTINFKIER